MRLPTTPALIGPLLGGLLAVGATAAPAAASHAPLPPGRDLRTHVVQPGETATELAVRYHAWTAELIAHNHLGPSATLHTGQRIVIPVVRSAVPDRERAGDRPVTSGARPDAAPVTDPSRARRARPDRPGLAPPRRAIPSSRSRCRGRRRGGRCTTSPTPARSARCRCCRRPRGGWSTTSDGPLRPRRLHDNAVTGVTLLRVLADNTRTQRHRVGAYYQGLGAVRDHGLYGETRAYVDNVLAIKRRLEQGRPPA